MTNRRPQKGDIVIDLQQTSGDAGLIPASVTDEVLKVWRGMYGSQVNSFRQKSGRRSSVDYEVVFITPNQGVDADVLGRQLRHTAQTVIAEMFSKARNR